MIGRTFRRGNHWAILLALGAALALAIWNSSSEQHQRIEAGQLQTINSRFGATDLAKNNTNNSTAANSIPIEPDTEFSSAQTNKVTHFKEVAVHEGFRIANEISSDNALTDQEKTHQLLSLLNRSSAVTRIKIWRGLAQLDQSQSLGNIVVELRNENEEAVKLAAVEALGLMAQKMRQAQDVNFEVVLNELEYVRQLNNGNALEKKTGEVLVYLYNLQGTDDSYPLKLDYLTTTDVYRQDIGLSFENNASNVSLGNLISEVRSLRLDTDKSMEYEHNKMNQAFLDYFSVPGNSVNRINTEDVQQFFSETMPKEHSEYSDSELKNYQMWLASYSNIFPPGSPAYSNLVNSRLMKTNSPVEAMVLVQAAKHDVLIAISNDRRKQLKELISNDANLLGQNPIENEIDDVLEKLTNAE